MKNGSLKSGEIAQMVKQLTVEWENPSSNPCGDDFFNLRIFEIKPYWIELNWIFLTKKLQQKTLVGGWVGEWVSMGMGMGMG